MTKTQNYQLNQWDASDPIRREDFNADNQKIDAALGGMPKIVVGSYIGDGSSPRTIELGFKPAFVILIGTYYFNGNNYGSVTIAGDSFALMIYERSTSIEYIRTTGTGFCINNADYHNVSNRKEYYIAFKG